MSMPGVDGQGMIDLRDLAKRAKGLDVAAFEKTYNVPALLVVPPDPGQLLEEAAAESGEEGFGFNTVRLSGAGAAARFEGRVLFLEKSTRNPFGYMISLGRAANNDVVLNVEAVSKMHGTFTKVGNDWTYADHNSTNGSFLNGTQLKPQDKQKIRSGDKLRFGRKLTAIYLDPRGLFERVRAEPV